MNCKHVRRILFAVFTMIFLNSGIRIVEASRGDDGWSDQFGNADFIGWPAACVGDSGQLILGGSFSIVDEIEVANVARYDGTSWSAMGDGLNDQVEDLIIFQGDPVACGQFTRSGAISVNHVARWNGAQWLPCGDGIRDVGGGFAEYGGALHCGRSRWDGSTWTELSLPAGSITDMVVLGNELYFCGTFFDGRGSPLSCVISWDGEVWQEIGELGDEPTQLEVFQGTLVVATPDGAAAVQRFIGGSWISILDSEYAYSFRWLVVAGDQLYLRAFVCYKNPPCGAYIWRYDGSGEAWTVLAFTGAEVLQIWFMDEWDDHLLMWGDILISEIHEQLALQNEDGIEPLLKRPHGIDGEVQELHDGPDLLVSGDFGKVGNMYVYNTAFWDGNNWYGYPEIEWYSPWIITSYKTAWCGSAFSYHHNIYSGPQGTKDDAKLPYTDHLLKWSDGIWSGIHFYTEFTKLHSVADHLFASSEQGIVSIEPDLSFSVFAAVSEGSVKDLCAFEGGMAAGGDFNAIDGVPLPGIGHYEDGGWSEIGDLSGNVVDLVTHADGLAAAGIIAIGDELPRRGVAIWNGVVWRRLGDAFEDSIHCLESYRGALFVAGSFISIDGQPMNKIAYWQGQEWRPVGSGIQGNRINDMEVHDGTLWVGGQFVGAGGHRAANICTWTGIVTPVLLQSFVARREQGLVALSWRCAGGPQGTFRVVRVADGGHIDLVAEVPAEEGTEWSCEDQNPMSGPMSYTLFLHNADGEELQLAEAGLDAEVLPQSPRLSSPRPNPFNPSVTVQLIAPLPATVDVAVYDVQGRRLRALLGGPVAVGSHPCTWDGRDDAGRTVGSGTYFVRLEADGRSEAIKILLAR